jgi:hypothetical protein
VPVATPFLLSIFRNLLRVLFGGQVMKYVIAVNKDISSETFMPKLIVEEIIKSLN